MGSQEPTTALGNATPPRESSAANHVLVVEDDEALARAIVRILGEEWDVECASNGQVALELFRRRAFDVLITDIAMPTMDGLALLDRVRQISDDVPVILITGSPTVESAIEAVELNAFKYLSKPFDAETLRISAREAGKHVRMARMRRQAVEIASGSGRGSADRMRAELNRARQTLWLAYQPIVDRRFDVLGYEALMRWDEGDFAGPMELFAAADELGMAADLGGQLRSLAPRPFLSDLDALLFLNLNPNEIGQPYMEVRDDPLALIADRVVLEVTEHLSMRNMAQIGPAISELKSIGYRLAVDDLGAGYSGLSSFARIGPDFVKLDRALVSGAGSEVHRQRVISGITRLCHELGMQVIAEGVERREDLHALVTLGCDLFQGYLIGRPEPLA